MSTPIRALARAQRSPLLTTFSPYDPETNLKISGKNINPFKSYGGKTVKILLDLPGPYNHIVVNVVL